MRPSLDKFTYLVVNHCVADYDDNARNVVTDERHRYHESWILVRQKLAVIVDRSQHPVSDQWVEGHYGRPHPKKQLRHQITLTIIIAPRAPQFIQLPCTELTGGRNNQ